VPKIAIDKIARALNSAEIGTSLAPVTIARAASGRYRAGPLAEPPLTRLLFVCSRNRLRSPTAEQVFAGREGLEVASAGTNRDADTPVTADLVGWADIVFVMEKAQREKLQARYRAALKDKRLVCLDIPDRFAFMDPALVALLERKVRPFLR